METPCLEELAAQAGSGDLRAAEQLIRGFHRPLFTFLHVMRIPRDDIEDLAQEITIQAYQSLSSCDASQPFLPWLRGIARHMAANYWRSRSRRQGTLTRFKQFLLHKAPSSSPDSIAAGSQEALDRCVDRLQGRRKELLTMKYAQGLDSTEIAEKLDRTAASVRQTFYRIREAIRQCLETVAREMA